MSIKRKKKGQQTLEDILILTVISEMQIKIRHLFDFFSSDWQKKKIRFAAAVNAGNAEWSGHLGGQPGIFH